MIRPIVLYGDPILGEISEEVGENYSKSDIRMLIEDMFETMHRAKGVGLSAIQIGVPLRIFVAEAHLPDDDFHFRGSFINPKIVKEFGELVKHPEGCLSVPGLAGLVERHENIELEYLDDEWKPHTKVFTGFAARIIQHEYDHLEGKVYVEHLDQMWFRTMEESLKLIEDRKMEVPYSWK